MALLWSTPVRVRVVRLLIVAVALLLAGGLVLPVARVGAATGDPVLLNELLVSHAGDDTTEFVELYGSPGHSLAGLSLVVVEGDGSAAGTIDLRIDLPDDATLGGNGYYLVGNPLGLGTHYGVTPDLPLASNAIENGSHTMALVATGSIGPVGSRVSGAEDVRDSVGLTDGWPDDAWFWGAPVVGPDDAFLPAGARRASTGVDTDTSGDWLFADHHLGPDNTPTAATPYTPPDPEPDPEPEPEPGPVPGDEAPSGLEALVAAFEQCVSDGHVAAARAGQLRSHLEKAARFQADGKPAAADAQLQAFVNQLGGFTPRWVDPAAADLLASLAAPD